MSVHLQEQLKREKICEERKQSEDRGECEGEQDEDEGE